MLAWSRRHACITAGQSHTWSRIAVLCACIVPGQSGGSPWLARPAALRLHVYACSGPRVMDRSWSSWPRSMGSLGWMGRPHRQQVSAPAWWSGARARRVRWCSAPYPRCCLVPRARSRARVWVGQRLVPCGTGVGQPASAQGCLARGMATSLRAWSPPAPASVVSPVPGGGVRRASLSRGPRGQGVRERTGRGLGSPRRAEVALSPARGLSGPALPRPGGRTRL